MSNPTAKQLIEDKLNEGKNVPFGEFSSEKAKAEAARVHKQNVAEVSKAFRQLESAIDAAMAAISNVNKRNVKANMSNADIQVLGRNYTDLFGFRKDHLKKMKLPWGY